MALVAEPTALQRTYRLVGEDALVVLCLGATVEQLLVTGARDAL